MAVVRITDLTLKTIIGINDWERKRKQKIVINASFRYDSRKAQQSDNIKDSVDYKIISKKIIGRVEKTKFSLLERLTAYILDIIMEDRAVREATVRVDKPLALRFSRSVSVELSKKRDK